MQARYFQFPSPSIPRLRCDGVRTHDALQVSLRNLEPAANFESSVNHDEPEPHGPAPTASCASTGV